MLTVVYTDNRFLYIGGSGQILAFQFPSYRNKELKISLCAKFHVASRVSAGVTKMAIDRGPKS